MRLQLYGVDKVAQPVKQCTADSVQSLYDCPHDAKMREVGSCMAMLDVHQLKDADVQEGAEMHTSMLVQPLRSQMPRMVRPPGPMTEPNRGTGTVTRTMRGTC